jgi:hypothetical protein
MGFQQSETGKTVKTLEVLGNLGLLPGAVLVRHSAPKAEIFQEELPAEST